MTTIVDCFKREIKIGDVISYPGRQSSSIWTNYAVVKRINENGSVRVIRNPQYTWNGDDGPRETTVHILSRVMILSKEDLYKVEDKNIKKLLDIAEALVDEAK